MKIGYVRVSRFEQNEALQIDALEAAGCERIFVDKGVSGAKASRPQFDKALEQLRKGDVFVVWKLDRMGRSLQHLIALMQVFEKKGVEVVSLTEMIDTSSPAGKLLFHVMGALAQFERELISERTKAGLAASRARGKKGGRKPITADHPQVILAKALFAQKQKTVKECCVALNVSRSQFYRLIHIGEEQPEKKKPSPEKGAQG